jgi:hypothetical protein
MPRETKLTFRPASVLLDKGVVRRVYEARVRLALGQPPTLQQAEAANVWARFRALAIPLYITAQTEHVLQRRSPVFATALLTHTRVLRKGRYLRRWARRLRDVSFSPEDAIVLAYGSFGLDFQAQRVGVEAIVTNDQKLATNFTTRFTVIQEHFTNMVGQLVEPYRELTLPRVVATAEMLAEE